MRRFDTAGAPHLPPSTSVGRVMGLVLLALLPGIGAHVWFFGPGLLVQIALAAGFALAFEACTLQVRQRPLKPFLTDLSAPVCAVLFALCVPPLAPWWVALTGMAAAMVFAKHLFGGLGHNLFNPAMVGYAVVLICFPLQLSQWPEPGAPVGAGETLRAIFLGTPPGAGWDAIAQATPLDTLRLQAAQGRTLGEIHADPAFGTLGGRGWEWLALAYALGGALLLWRRVIHWQVPTGVLAGVLMLTLPFWLMDPDLHPSPLQHLFSGALVLAAFFIATDPVTGCVSPRGRLLFGIGVAALTLAIRRWGLYPDGVAFAVLLMNCTAPWLDRVTRPRIYGEPR